MPEFTPYEGRTPQGTVETVILRGRRVVEDRKLKTTQPIGEHAPSSYATVAV